MTPYGQALAAADPRRVRAARTVAAASALLGEFGAVAETEALYDAGLLTVSETDMMCEAQARVAQAARVLESAQEQADAAQADAAAATGAGAAEAGEVAAAASAAAGAASAVLALAIEDAVGTCVIMRRGLVARHGGVQQAVDEAGVLAGRRFHGA
jgi:hypothetical protein